MSDWRDSIGKTGEQAGRVVFRDKPAPPAKGKGGLITILLLLVVAGGGAGGFAWWKAQARPVEDAPAQPAPEPEPFAAIADPEPVADVPEAALPIEPAPLVVAPEVGPTLPVKPVRAVDVAAIKRGIDLLERNAAEHRNAAAAWQAKIDTGLTQRFSSPGGYRTYLEIQRDDLRRAIATKDGALKFRAEQNIELFNAKVLEYRGKKAHELEVLGSIESRLADERTRLP